VFDIFNDTLGLTAAQVRTKVVNYCSASGSGCQATLNTALGTVIAQCAAFITVEGTWDDIGAMLLIVNLPCLHTGTSPNEQWCFPDFRDFTDALQANTITQATLTAGCTECTAKVAFLWLAFEPKIDTLKAVAFVDLICLNIDGQFCSVTWNAFLAHVGDPAFNFTTFINDELNTYCVPCNLAFLNKYLRLVTWFAALNQTCDDGHGNVVPCADIILSTLSFEYILRYFCTQDFHGNYCLKKLLHVDFNAIGVACAGASLTDICPASCKTAVQSFARDMGCCLQTWLDAETLACTTNPYSPDNIGTCSLFNTSPPGPAAITSMRYLIYTGCEAPLVASCAAIRQQLAGEFIVANLAWAWCHATPANLATCTAIVEQALADLLGLALADIHGKVVLSQGTAPPTRRLLSTDSVAVTLTGVTPEQSGGNLNTAAALATQTASVPGAAPETRADLSQPVTISGSATVTNSPNPGSAAALAPSFLFALLALVTVLFN